MTVVDVDPAVVGIPADVRHEATGEAGASAEGYNLLVQVLAGGQEVGQTEEQTLQESDGLDLALSKDEREGTFFELGDTILSVYAKTEYFSRDQPGK